MISSIVFLSVSCLSLVFFLYVISISLFTPSFKIVNFQYCYETLSFPQNAIGSNYLISIPFASILSYPSKRNF